MAWRQPGQYFKDGINDAIVHGRFEALNPAGVGTKAAAHYELLVPAGGTATVKVRFAPAGATGPAAPASTT